MGLISKLKMKCTISRPPETPNEKMDSFASLTLNWDIVEEDVNCFIFDSSFTMGSLVPSDSGLNPKNQYRGIFLPNQDIKEGDKVNCSKIGNFDLLVESAIPFVHPVKNKIHHIDVLFSVMQ